jgi:hypothetical protein
LACTSRLAPLTLARLHLAPPPHTSATHRYKTAMSSEAELDRAAAALVAFISASPHSSGPPGRVSCGIGLYSEFCKTYPSHAATIRSQGGMRAFVTRRRELMWIDAMAGIGEPRIGLSGVSPQRASQPLPPPQQQQPPPQEQPQSQQVGVPSHRACMTSMSLRLCGCVSEYVLTRACHCLSVVVQAVSTNPCIGCIVTESLLIAHRPQCV